MSRSVLTPWIMRVAEAEAARRRRQRIRVGVTITIVLMVVFAALWLAVRWT